MACNEGHWKWLSTLQRSLSAEGNNVAIVVIGYTLAPAGQFPVQLREAVESLHWITSKYKKEGKDVSWSYISQWCNAQIC